MIYKYYYNYFILHFCVSLHQVTKPLQQHLLNGIKHIQITYFLQLARKNKPFFFRALFLLTIAFAKHGVVRWIGQNNYAYIVNYTRTSLFRFYEKFIIFMYAQTSRKPISYNDGLNDLASITAKHYTSLEEYFFGLHLVERTFGGYMAINFFFTPLKTIDCYFHRNLLRMLNLPIQMQKLR